MRKPPSTKHGSPGSTPELRLIRTMQHYKLANLVSGNSCQTKWMRLVCSSTNPGNCMWSQYTRFACVSALHHIIEACKWIPGNDLAKRALNVIILALSICDLWHSDRSTRWPLFVKGAVHCFSKFHFVFFEVVFRACMACGFLLQCLQPLFDKELFDGFLFISASLGFPLQFQSSLWMFHAVV